MVNRFTPKAQAALTTAKKCAEKMGHSYIGTEHLILGILSCECVGKRLLEEKRITYSEVYSKLAEIAGIGNEDKESIRQLTPKCKRAIEMSAVCAKRLGVHLIGTEHMLYAICEDGECVGGRILISLGVNLQILKNEISAIIEGGRDTREGTQGVPGCPVLSAHGKNLNLWARQGKADPLIGRDKELLRLIQILSRRTKNNPCLIGEPGVGKTAIIEGLAQRINEGNVPEGLLNKTIVSLDLSSMIAGAKYRGEFEERLRGVMSEAKNNDSVILFIDEIHTIIGAGAAEGAVDAANIIKPALARAELQIIGATTFEEYRHHIEKDAALERRFQPVTVSEPTENEAIDIILGLREKYEAFHGVKIPKEVIEHAVKLSVRYINDRFLPDKAIDLIDEACSRVKMGKKSTQGELKALSEQIRMCNEEKEQAILTGSYPLASEIQEQESRLLQKLESATKITEQENDVEIKNGDVESIVTQWTNIPVSSIEKNESLRLCSLEKELECEVIGQGEAISKVASSIKRGRAGLKSPKRPIGSFMFCGPSGVGKTHLAKAIAKKVFGSQGCLIRLDMSEYMEKHSVSKLIGSPPGYVGYEEGGSLTKQIKQKPYSVVLFDEIEKAHADIYNILLQILDEGTLTDSSGRTVSFKNTVLILTSNVGVKELKSHSTAGFSPLNNQKELDKRKIKECLSREFSIEFLNRLDEIIVFDPLGKEDAEKIAEIMLSELILLGRDIGIELTFDKSIYEHIAKSAYSNEYGARPLRRAIMSLIETPLSEKLLLQEIKKGDRVSVFCEKEEIKFKCFSLI